MEIYSNYEAKASLVMFCDFIDRTRWYSCAQKQSQGPLQECFLSDPLGNIFILVQKLRNSEILSFSIYTWLNFDLIQCIMAHVQDAIVVHNCSL